MPDVVIDPCGNQRGGLFKGEELRFQLSMFNGFPLGDQRADSKGKGDNAYQE